MPQDPRGSPGCKFPSTADRDRTRGVRGFRIVPASAAALSRLRFQRVKTIGGNSDSGCVLPTFGLSS